MESGATTTVEARPPGQWLALGRKFESRAQWHDAVSSAQAGLDELGDEYAGPDVEDDSDLKLMAAEERLAQGHTSDGASVMLRVLGDRVRLYARRHQQEIVE